MEGESGQSALYTYLEISQWNPFVQSMYSNKKTKKPKEQDWVLSPGMQ
jgi:hypothetical protein